MKLSEVPEKVYNGTLLNWKPLGEFKVSWIVRCPFHDQGLKYRFVTEKMSCLWWSPV